MRRIVPLTATVLALGLLASPASAQPHFNGLGLHAPVAVYPTPRAPDFQNTRPFYYNTCYGMTYGPNWCVYPGFAPYQGVLPVQQPNWPCGPSGAQALAAQQMGIAAFPSHLYARGPRDYFMIETDPRASPYTYGLTNFPSLPHAALGSPAPLGGTSAPAGLQVP
ncbi:MAG: hypothetical protein U0797_09885 [Gemmataceae bacterium]